MQVRCTINLVLLFVSQVYTKASTRADREHQAVVSEFTPSHSSWFPLLLNKLKCKEGVIKTRSPCFSYGCIIGQFGLICGARPRQNTCCQCCVTSLPNQAGRGSFSIQTLNGGHTMNSHNSGSVAPLTGTTMTSGTGTTDSSGAAATAVNNGPGLSKQGLAKATMPPSSNSVIQTPFMNSQNVVTSVQPASQAGGPTVTLVRPSMQTAGSGITFNGNNNTAGPPLAANAASQPATSAPVIGIQTTLVNNGQPSTAVSVCAGSNLIKAEAPKTIIQTAPQQALTPGAISAPRTSTPATVAASPGGVRALATQGLATRLPQTSPGQPNIQNIQLPPGE